MTRHTSSAARNASQNAASSTSGPFRKIVPPTNRNLNFFLVAKVIGFSPGRNFFESTPLAKTRTFSGAMPELRYIARTSADGTQNSSRLEEASTQAFGKAPYSQGWTTTRAPLEGRLHLGGH